MVPTGAGHHDRDRAGGRWPCRTASAHRELDRVPSRRECGAVLVAPIPPDAGGFSGRPSAPGRCEFGRIGLAPLSQYLHCGDTTSTSSCSYRSAWRSDSSVGPRPRPGCLWLSLPSKPSDRGCRCSDRGARAGMSSTTSSGLPSVWCWGCCCQSFERAGPGGAALGVPRGHPTHEVGAKPSATSCVETGNATERSRSNRNSTSLTC